MTAPAIVIAVPVRDEADRLPALLTALAEQRTPLPFVLCLHLDGCRDASEAVVAGMASTLPYRIATSASPRRGPPNAGRARASAAALALAQADAPALLSTDADTQPDHDWVAATVAALERADIVAGRVRVAARAQSPLQRRLADYLDRLHVHRRALDPVDWEDQLTHHWTSAASLAFAPGTYSALGPFAPVPRGEDGDMADRAWRAGFRIRRDARVRVLTSGRRQGRAAGGFAYMLETFDHSGACPRVAHPADESWRYRFHAMARQSFESGSLDVLARAVRLGPAEVARIAADCPNADAFAARVVGTPPGGMRQVSLADAEQMLAALVTNEMAGAA